MSKEYLACPACKSTNIRAGGFTATYYYCENCKSGRYRETHESNYLDFLREGNKQLQALHIKGNSSERD